MNAEAKRWVEKAEADFAAASLLRRSRKRAMREVVCFHLQQCIEKLIKARLVKGNVQFPKTHDLALLIRIALPTEPLWEVFLPLCEELTQFAVAGRYPGDEISSTDASKLFKAAMKMRTAMLASLD